MDENSPDDTPAIKILPNEITYNGTDVDDNTTNFFIVQYNITKFENLRYITSTCNNKYTAILYLKTESSTLILVILKNIFDLKRENIKYQNISTMSFEVNKIQAILSDEILNGTQSEDEDYKPKKIFTYSYNLFLVNNSYIILQCVKKKIILIDFLTKKYTTLYVNSENHHNVRVISTFDELIVIKQNDDNLQYLTRTYVFCVSNNQLYFFILNENVITNQQFIMHKFPFEENYNSVEEFLIQRIDSKNNENKWFYIMVLLINGKLIRYVTNWLTVSIKYVLLHFKQYVVNNIIKKTVNSFDKIKNCHIKIYYSKNCVSFIILALGDTDILAFKFYDSDSPEDVKKRFNIGEFENYVSSSHSNNNNSNNTNSIDSNQSRETTNIEDKDKLDFYKTPSTGVRISKGNIFPIYNKTDQIQYLNPSNVSNFILDGNQKNTDSKSSSSLKILFSSKEKCIIHYSLSEKEKSLEFTTFMRNNHTSEKNLIYCFTYFHLFKFKQFSNLISIYKYPNPKNKNESGILMSKIFYEKKFIPNDIKLYDVLHYEYLNYSFILTNKFIIKFRINNYFYSLVYKSARISYSPSTTNEDSFSKLKIVTKYDKIEKIKKKCKVCKKKKPTFVCKKCKFISYCSKEHMEYDRRNFHFFECEFLKFIKAFDSTNKESKKLNFKLINGVVKTLKNILNRLFRLVETPLDYNTYLIFLKIMLNILPMIKIENFINENMNKFKNIVITEPRTVCDKIFNMELWFFYSNLNILYTNFALKAGLNILSSNSFRNAKMMDLIRKKDTKITSLFAYFGLSNDLYQYDISKSRLEIVEYSKHFFFNLPQIYTNDYQDENHLNIHEHFMLYHMNSLTSLLKIGMKLGEINSYKSLIGYLTSIMFLIPNLLEDKLNNGEYANDYLSAQLTLAYIYYYLSFILVEIEKIPSSIIVLNYVYSLLEKSVNLYSFQSKVLLNTGILLNFTGNNDSGIHKMEEAYRIAVNKNSSLDYQCKILKLLILAYININKVYNAYLLIKESINKIKGVLGITEDFSNSSSFKYYKLLLKLKAYLLFIVEFMGYKYNKSKKLGTNKKKNDKKMVENLIAVSQNEIPDSILPSKFNLISNQLIKYVGENDLKFKKEFQSQEEISANNWFENQNTKNNPFLLINFQNDIKTALEFLYEFKPQEFHQINEDNSAVVVEDNNKDEIHDKSNSNLSKELSVSYINAFKEKNITLKDEEINYLDEIEIKMELFDMLNSHQQKKLKEINNKILLRSILLRDPKGTIDKFNLNYHPKYTYEFFSLVNKLEENYFIKNYANLYIIEDYEVKLFDYKAGYILLGLRKFLNLDKIKNIIFIHKLKFLDKIKKNELSLITSNDISNDEKGKRDWVKKLKKVCEKNNYPFTDNLNHLLENVIEILNDKERQFLFENPQYLLNFIYIDRNAKYEDIKREINTINLSQSSESLKSHSSTSQIQETNLINSSNYANFRFTMKSPSSIENNDSFQFSTKNLTNKVVKFTLNTSKNKEYYDESLSENEDDNNNNNNNGFYLLDKKNSSKKTITLRPFNNINIETSKSMKVLHSVKEEEASIIRKDKTSIIGKDLTEIIEDKIDEKKDLKLMPKQSKESKDIPTIILKEMDDSSKSKRKNSFITNNNTNENNNYKMKIEEDMKNVSKIDEDKDNLNYSPFITDNINEMLKVSDKQSGFASIKNSQNDIKFSNKESKKNSIYKPPIIPKKKFSNSAKKDPIIKKKTLEKNIPVKNKKETLNKNTSKEVINDEIPEEIIKALMENTIISKGNDSIKKSIISDSTKKSQSENQNINYEKNNEGVKFQYFDRRPPSYKTLKQRVLKRAPK